MEPQAINPISPLNTPALKTLVLNYCRSHALNYDIISGLISVESNWHPKRARYEPAFNYFSQPYKWAALQSISQDTEMTLQRTSWGLMQLMGATARSLSYDLWLPDLCDPMTGIIWGCEYFKSRAAHYPDVKDQISAYNAGTPRKRGDGTYENQAYVDKVLAAMRSS
jgi:hypothetical protein